MDQITDLRQRMAAAKQRAADAEAERAQYALPASTGDTAARKALEALSKAQASAEREAGDLVLAIRQAEGERDEARRVAAEADADRRLKEAIDLTALLVADANLMDSAARALTEAKARINKGARALAFTGALPHEQIARLVAGKGWWSRILVNHGFNGWTELTTADGLDRKTTFADFVAACCSQIKRPAVASESDAA